MQVRLDVQGGTLIDLTMPGVPRVGDSITFQNGNFGIVDVTVQRVIWTPGEDDSHDVKVIARTAPTEPLVQVGWSDSPE